MVNKKIEELIVKFIIKSITEPELDILSTWLEHPENERQFIKYIQLNYALDYNLSRYDAEKTKRLLQARMDLIQTKQRKPRKLSFYKYAAAATIAILVATSVLFFRTKEVDETSGVVNSETQILPGSNKAVLTLEDGSNVILEKGNSFQTDKLKSEGENIVYNGPTDTDTNIAYNYLTIPRGGQFFVELCDGTRVWLNSESKLKYPVSFPKGQDRVVELVYGEAYFEVSPSIDHNGSRFSVIGRDQTIEVLGTKFNIKAYKDEDITYSTLVEGKVLVDSGIESKELRPGQQSKISNDGTIDVAQVKVFDIISWKEEVFSFNGASLSEISKVLTRWYDVDIIFEDKKLEQTRFIGIFRKSQNLEQIFKIIENTHFINAYEIKGDSIIIK